MRHLLFTSLLLCLFLPRTAFAQTWTAEEQDVLNTIEMCWDAWMEAVQQNDPEIWFAKCRPADNYSMWWDAGTPEGPRQIRRDWDSIRQVDATWIDFRPVAVRIHGDVAIVQFYGYWKANTPEGPATTEYKRTEVFRKVSGHWTFLGGQGTPASPRDAEPYN